MDNLLITIPVIIVIIAYDCLFVYLNWKLAGKKNRDRITWAILGFFFSLISYIVLQFCKELERPPSKMTTKINWLSAPGIVLGIMYLIYSVVSMILSMLDRTYNDIEMNFLFDMTHSI